MKREAFTVMAMQLESIHRRMVDLGLSAVRGFEREAEQAEARLAEFRNLEVRLQSIEDRYLALGEDFEEHRQEVRAYRLAIAEGLAE